MTCMAAAPTRRERLLTAGVWLREQRKALHLTQEELARLVGVSNASLSAYERGVSAPDDVTIDALARVVRQPVGEVRERWGLYNSGLPDTPPPPVSVIDAIRADPSLIPEAKNHLAAQYELLLRLTRGPEPSTADILARELEAQERFENESSRNGVETDRRGDR